jgi:hypothetical protein
VVVADAHLDGDHIVYDKGFVYIDDEDLEDYDFLDEEVVIRELLELDLGDAEALAAFVDTFGLIVRPAGEIGIPTWFIQADTVKVEDVRYWLDLIARASRHWLLSQTGGDVREAWEAHNLDESEAWQRFVTVVNWGLSGAYSTRLELHVEEVADLWDEYHIGIPRPDLFEALCLQLHQLVVADLPVRTCANETCGRAFVRQRGTAEYGQYRTKGVQYCSRPCAKAQMQRAYRRRQRKDGQ